MGKTIRELREEKGWTREYVARQLGVTITTVYNWERDRFDPRATQFRAMARLFGVPMDAIALPSDPENGTSRRDTPDG